MALWGKTDANISRPNWLEVGQIKKVNVTVGGTAYTTATVAIAAPASGVQATATATIVGGVVTSITITNPGSGYISTDAATVTITGDGADATAAAVKAAVVYDPATVVFVDSTEALLAANKGRGITGAGWWVVKSYTDQHGETRHKAECIVAMGVTNAVAGDAADDAIVADVANVITISGQPTDQDTSSGAATFAVTAATDGVGALSYMWQVKAAGASRWMNVVGATSASLVLAAQDADNDGDMYRVNIASTDGAPDVRSAAVTLSFVD